jgi:hypothetical protein
MTPREEIASVPYAITAGDVIGDIHPTTVSIGTTAVIDATGKWVGSPTGLVGPKGDTGAMGPMGLAGAKGDPGAMGLQGPMGLQGAAGVPCTNGCVNTASLATGAVTAAKIVGGALSHDHTLAVTVRQSVLTPLPANGNATATATCTSGVAIAGGCNFQQGLPVNGAFNLVSSAPSDGVNFNPPNGAIPTGWMCYYENTSASAGSFFAFVVCAGVNNRTLP